MPIPDPGSLDDLRTQRHDLGVHALLAIGPAILALGAWLGLRAQIRRIEDELVALEPVPDDPIDGPIDVESRPTTVAETPPQAVHGE